MTKTKNPWKNRKRDLKHELAYAVVRHNKQPEELLEFLIDNLIDHTIVLAEDGIHYTLEVPYVNKRYITYKDPNPNRSGEWIKSEKIK